MSGRLSRAVTAAATFLLTVAVAAGGAQAASAVESTPYSGPGSISGTVSDADGAALTQQVEVHATQGSYVAKWSAYVDSDTGAYTIDDLPLGDYTVYFQTVPGTSIFEPAYLRQYWDGVYEEQQATTISLTTQHPSASDIDAAMTFGGTVSWNAFISGTTTPAEGVSVDLYRQSSDGTFQQVYGSEATSAGADIITDLIPGEYTLYFDASTRTVSPALTSTWLGGAATLPEAQTFTVSPNQTSLASQYLTPVSTPTDPLASLPCVNAKDRGALRDLIAQFERTGIAVRDLTRTDLTHYLTRCR